MNTQILMNVKDDHELRVAIIKEGVLQQIVHERIKEQQQLGNVYKGKVANVEPSLDAAFVDIGGDKNGFLHVNDVLHDKGENARIEQVLKPGQEVLVQITKEAIRDKGPCITMHVSLPGRYLVLMSSHGGKKGISKKIVDEAKRKRLRSILASYEGPEGFGFIVRTAGADRLKEELDLDYAYLKTLWSEIEKQVETQSAPCSVYQEAHVTLRVLRDLVSADVDKIIIDNEKFYDDARAFTQIFMPEITNALYYHNAEVPLFVSYGVEDRLAVLLDRQVELPSGGNIVIEQTEALISIDINSAKNRTGSDVAQTALITNLEAAQVICEQLRLRDLGGIVIIDFIDMESRDHQRKVQLALRRALAMDKAKSHVAPISRFGLVELTRQRTRPSHKLVSSTQCTYCGGSGLLKTAESLSIECMRALRSKLSQARYSRCEVVMPADAAVTMMNTRRAEIAELERSFDCKIIFVSDNLMKTRTFHLNATKSSSARKGKRSSKVVSPELVAPMVQEHARVADEARRLVEMNTSVLEKEVYARENPQDYEQAANKVVTEETHKPIKTVHVPSLAEEAYQLRELLFSAA